MNDRIKELVKVAERNLHDRTGQTWAIHPVIAHEFAELIVRECCDWIDGSPTSESGCQLLLTKSFIIANLKGHFGV